MKKTRKLLPAIAMLLMSAVMMTTASFAWFSLNDTVTVSNMQVKAQAAGSLVINKVGDTASLGVGTTVEFDELDANDAGLKPITFTNSQYQYCTNTTEILPETGLPASGTDVAYAPVTADDKINYYRDYVVYLSASGDALADKTLKATVTFPEGLQYNQQALTVAFTVGTAEAASATKAFSLHQAPTVVDSTECKAIAKDGTSVEVTLSNNDLDIPLYTDSENVVPVLMRVYYDGALVEDGDTTKTYVRSQNIATTAITIGVSFKVS